MAKRFLGAAIMVAAAAIALQSTGTTHRTASNPRAAGAETSASNRHSVEWVKSQVRIRIPNEGHLESGPFIDGAVTHEMI